MKQRIPNEPWVRTDVLDRLQIDPGQRTLGQLLQDRGAAAHEITRLRAEVDRLRRDPTAKAAEAWAKGRLSTREVEPSEPAAFRPGTLMRLADLCKFLSVSRSSIYKWISDGTFPEPVRLGQRMVRWRIEAIVAWRDASRI
jgi:prophage regulatory protein